MGGFRIPGAIGSTIILHIDSGTLVRVTSLAPGVLELEGVVSDWAGREIRRGARQGLRLVGEVAYDAAMRELRSLEGDVEAKLRYIADLPVELRNRVAYDSFAAGFDHYLPKKFIHHFVYGHGTDVTLTLQEMIDCNPLITLQRSKAFRDLLISSAKQPGKKFPFELGVLSGALTNGSLGQFTARCKGDLIVNADGSWQASGTMSFYDEWDFDPKDFTTGGRSYQGEVKTRVANALLPGQGFKIYSAVTRFTQDQSDTTVQWAGGEPKGSPDRIAALDIELSKPDK